MTFVLESVKPLNYVKKNNHVSLSKVATKAFVRNEQRNEGCVRLLFWLYFTFLPSEIKLFKSKWL